MSKQYPAPPEMQIDPSKKYQAIFKTEVGDMTIDLYAAQAPISVNNFVALARDGFYDNTVFHRVIDGFMAQGGDPTGTGRGGPGYKFNDEAGALSLKHDGRGVLSMANAGPNTNGSQFFITHEATPHLDGKHGVLGKLSAGDDVLGKIKKAPPHDRSGMVTDPTKILTIEIIES